VEKDAEKTLVRKICPFNIDEIEHRLRTYAVDRNKEKDAVVGKNRKTKTETEKIKT